MEGITMTYDKPVNLLEKQFARAEKSEALQFTAKHGHKHQHPRFSIGDKITFWAGYNGDIRYLSEITGIDENGEIYVVWDCFWSPIRDEPRRKIELATSN
jgi:hypothetical protein